MSRMYFEEYETEIYPFKLWILIAKDREEVLKRFVDYTDGTPLKDIPKEDYIWSVEEPKTGHYGVLMVFYNEDSIVFRTVAHEVIHTVSDLLTMIGDEMSGNEQTAYLAGWIADCCEKAKEQSLKINS